MNVYSRTKSKCDSLVEAGATWCNSPESLANGSDVVFTYVVRSPCIFRVWPHTVVN